MMAANKVYNREMKKIVLKRHKQSRVTLIKANCYKVVWKDKNDDRKKKALSTLIFGDGMSCVTLNARRNSRCGYQFAFVVFESQLYVKMEMLVSVGTFSVFHFQSISLFNSTSSFAIFGPLFLFFNLIFLWYFMLKRLFLGIFPRNFSFW